jgi:hypothetical protein
MTKRITQSTFNEAVKENMEDFDMALSEAIEETVKQFKGQGVSLDTIDLSGGVGLEEFQAAVWTLNDSLSNESETLRNKTNILKSLDTLKNLTSPACEFSDRNKKLLLHQGGLSKLYLILGRVQEFAIIDALINVLLLITRTQGMTFHQFLVSF